MSNTTGNRVQRLVYTESELMEALAISRNSIRQLREAGRLKYFEVGRTIRYPVSSVLEFLDTACNPREAS